jgi:hypothetical protein
MTMTKKTPSAVAMPLTDTQRERLIRIRGAFQKDIEKHYDLEVLEILAGRDELDWMTLQELRDMPVEVLNAAANSTTGAELLADIEALRAEGLLR